MNLHNGSEGYKTQAEEPLENEMQMILEEIDQLEVTVLVDNYTDLTRNDSTPVFRRPTLSYGEVLLAEHGLS